jgi:hypothetical protein
MWDFEKKRHRDLLAEACADLRSYQADGGAARYRLENTPPGAGTPVKGAGVPHVLTIEQVQGKWWANDKAIGPFDTVRDLELAVYGKSDLSGHRRNPLDDAWPTDE